MVARARGWTARRGGTRERAGRRFGRLVAAILAANVTVLTVATVLHNGYHVSFALAEGGLINSVDAAQLLAAGVLGIMTFRLFWRGAAARASTDEAAGIFLWGCWARA